MSKELQEVEVGFSENSNFDFNHSPNKTIIFLIKSEDLNTGILKGYFKRKVKQTIVTGNDRHLTFDDFMKANGTFYVEFDLKSEYKVEDVKEEASGEFKGYLLYTLKKVDGVIN